MLSDFTGRIVISDIIVLTQSQIIYVNHIMNDTVLVTDNEILSMFNEQNKLIVKIQERNRLNNRVDFYVKIIEQG